MGRGRGRRNSWGGGRGGGGRDRGEKRTREGGDGGAPPGGWAEATNAAFEEYYKTQGIVPEEDWGVFMETLRKPLPVTFRINGGGRFASQLRDKMQEDFFSHFKKGDAMMEDDELQPPKPLPWYPNKLGWHMSFTRQQLRKTPILGEIHEFLVKANDHGSISRQEAVSMVPPLFLDVQPHHAVLDMCAAPGSKTQQLLEALHSGDSVPTGFVVANDADFKRCNLLTHQTKKVCSPSLLVTNHSAEMMPSVMITGPGGKAQPLRFDRILADVPCSGDGTMRKAPDIWRRWTVGGGNGLHLMQLRIALQGCRLLKVGGRMVYSTCTFNPIEDEAVVAELLETCKGAMELMDVSSELPELRRLPGMTQWKVRDKYRWYDSWEEAKDKCFKLDPTMFPSASKAKLNLERCMRFLPHHQDTGGFFVCVLKKVRDLPDFDLPSIRDRQGTLTKQQQEEEEAEAAAAAEAEAARMKEEEEEAGVKEEEGAGVKEEEGEEGAGVPAEVEEAVKKALKPAARQVERVPPLDIAKSAAQQAIDAAERAVTAFESKDQVAVAGAVSDANRAGDRAGFALDMHNREQKKASKSSKGKEDAAAGSSKGNGAGPSKGAAEGGEEDAAGPRVKPSWVRGGGGRNREGADKSGNSGGSYGHIDPIVPVEDPAILKPLVDYYGLSPDFPLWTQLVSRSLETNRPKRIYFVSQPLLDIMVRDEREQLKITATGLKVFERQDIKDSTDNCQYRLAQEGLPFMLPFIRGQRLQLSKQDFLALLRERSLMFPDAGVMEAEKVEKERSEGKQRTVIQDAELLEQLPKIKPGCVVVELRRSDAEALGLTSPESEAGALTANAPLALSAWKGKASLAIMVDKNECQQMENKINSAALKQAA